MTKTRCFLFAGLCFVQSVAAGESGGTPPSTDTKVPLTGPILTRVPAYSHWEIIVKPSDGSEISTTEAGKTKPAVATLKATKGKPPAEMTIAVTKTGDVLHVEFRSKQGDKAQEWHQGEFQITTRPEWQEPLLSTPGNPADVSYANYSTSDFPALHWLSKKNYVGIEEKDNHACLVFRDKLLVSASGKEATLSSTPGRAEHTEGSSEADENPSVITVAAYIDYYSRLPMAAYRDQEQSSYEFKRPPDAMQVLPNELQAFIDSRRTQIGAQVHPPAKP